MLQISKIQHPAAAFFPLIGFGKLPHQLHQPLKRQMGLL